MITGAITPLRSAPSGSAAGEPELPSRYHIVALP